jgi:GAF domain-containing protein/CheY-like chemotaxis protein
MARFSSTRRLTQPCIWLLWSVAVCPSASAQNQLTLEQAAQRRPGDFTAVYLNAQVVLRGTVNAEPFHFPDQTEVSMDDGKWGALLRVEKGDSRLDALRPGDNLEVEGKVVQPSGMTMIAPSRIQTLGRSAAPTPIKVSAAELQSLRYLGRLVRIEGQVRDLSRTTPGVTIILQGDGSRLQVLVPAATPQQQETQPFNPGDRLRVTGVSHQFCTRPPYNQRFELLTHDGAIVEQQQAWFFAPIAVAVVIGVLSLCGFVVWGRDRRLRQQRETLRKTYKLGEEILGLSSTQSILNRLSETLPRILDVTRVQLYVYNRASKTLETVSGDTGVATSINTSSPPAGTAAGAVACFHYHTLLVIPDIDRSPFPMGNKGTEGAPRSMLFVPMLSHGEVIGVLELDQDNRARDFSSDEQELAQHLGNQIGVALRLLDQRSVQEQLFRTEKLAAVGRLISGVVAELETPLSSISDLANRALERARLGPAEREVAAIASEAQKAAGMVARLVSFAAAEQGDARAVSVGALLASLIEFREGDWKASGIRVCDLTSRDPLFVLGSQGQLEQVFLNLLVHAEQCLTAAPQKLITIRTSVFAKRLLVEITFTAPAGSSTVEDTAAVLGVTRSVIVGHGGEVRLIDKNNDDPRFEVELPLIAKERAASIAAPAANGPAPEYPQGLTALMIEPDDNAQRQLLGLLATRGFRVVPVTNADNGLELAHRMRFDVALCSVHAPGLNWVELSERMHPRAELSGRAHPRVGGFVLLSDGYDAELSADFEGDGCFVLAKPVQERELDRVLREILEPPSAGLLKPA